MAKLTPSLLLFDDAVAVVVRKPLLIDTIITTKTNALLTVGLLVSGSGAGSSELLGLVSPGIGDEQRSVVTDQDILDLLLRRLIDVFLVVSDQRLRNGLTDRCVRGA